MMVRVLLPLPMFMVGPVYNMPPPFQPSKCIGADVVIQEGMAFSFEPGARLGFGPTGKHAKVGATALITADGINVINKLGLRMHRV